MAVFMGKSRKNQRIGDRWAKTMVVKKRDIADILPERSMLRFLTANFLGALVDGAIVGLWLLIKLLS